MPILWRTAGNILSNPQKRKGSRVEREMVRRINEIGDAYRIPLSGAVEGFKGDIKLRIGDKWYTAEVKARKNPPKQVLGWLGEHDFLFIKPDLKEPVVVMTWKTWTELMGRE